MQEPSLDTAADRPQAEEVVFGAEMCWWAKLLNGLALAGLVAVSVGFVWMMSSLPRIEGKMPIKGLELPATITRDQYGIPRIAARSVRDAYFVMGWVHAQDRIWQMELQRRVGAGRLAELVGEKGLSNDRFMRTLGLYRLAEASLPKLDKPTRDALTAYSEGVNAWVDAHWHRLPVEFLLLNDRPEPWKPADSLVWGRLMALQLTGNWRDDVLKAKLAGKLDPRRLGELFPGYPADAPVTLGGRTATGLLEAIPEAAEPRLASNVWAVAGSRTASGKPLLANDPHLGFQAPVLWYLASVDAPGLSISGATVPGVPFHLVGHNGRIAWGTTTTHADTVDLFVEKQVGDEAYQTPEGPRPFTTRQEVIKVKDGADVTLTVRETRHGPVVSDLLAKDLAKPGTVVALRATALEGDDLTAQALHRLNRAVDWKGFLGALKDFHAPVQNFAYADTAGNIGFITAGRIPVRAGGDGSLPANGASADRDWKGWIPFERLPQQFNPKSGRVVNANNKVVSDSYPYLISATWPDGYRAARINELLDGKSKLKLADMAAMQMDDLSPAALELKDLLSGVAPADPLAREAATRIAAWDGHARSDGPEALIFAAWIEQLWRGIFADELGADFKEYEWPRPYVLRQALTTARHWCDDVTTPQAESCDDQIAAALERAIQDLSRRHGVAIASWRWGDEHRARFEHPILSHLPVLDRLSTITVATDGDDNTINRGSFIPGSHVHAHGAGLRAVYDLSDLSQSRFVIASGQSGNMLSRHYSDQTENWRVNRGLTIGAGAEAVAVLSLEPGY